jgi:hypothetical protein
MSYRRSRLSTPTSSLPLKAASAPGTPSTGVLCTSSIRLPPSRKRYRCTNPSAVQRQAGRGGGRHRVWDSNQMQMCVIFHQRMGGWVVNAWCACLTRLTPIRLTHIPPLSGTCQCPRRQHHQAPPASPHTHTCPSSSACPHTDTHTLTLCLPGVELESLSCAHSQQCAVFRVRVKVDQADTNTCG